MAARESAAGAERADLSRWLRLVVAAACAVGAAAAAGHLQVEGDTFWHLKTGEWILKNTAVPKTDPFSWTAQGNPWHAHEWLWDVLAWLGWLRWQEKGVWLLSAAGAVLWTWALFRLLKRSPLGVPIAGLAVIASAFFWSARPHTLAQGIFAAWAAAVFEAPFSGIAAFVVSAVTGALWGNLHGSAPLGAVAALLVALFSEADRRRDRLVMAAGLACGVALNPWGLDAFGYAVVASSAPDIVDNIGEWASPNFHRMAFLLPYAVFTCLSVFAAGRRLRTGGRLAAAEAVLAGIFALLALKSVRHLPYYYFAAALYCGRELADVRPPRFAEVSLAAAVAAALLAVGVSTWPPTWAEAPREFLPFPDAAVRYMKAAGLTDRVFNYYSWGGYLIFNGVRPFVDGRADMYVLSGSRAFEDYIAAFGKFWGMRFRPADPIGVFDRWGVKTVLVPPGTPPALALENRPGWHEAYRDSVAVVYVRGGDTEAVPQP